jgi:hypothetical protein
MYMLAFFVLALELSDARHPGGVEGAGPRGLDASEEEDYNGGS